ncbi:hypothetical protein AAT19DRAFT_8939 [Rhodotorula toruloides]|uniref:Uncharacterized protein n=1 Tax=Rhodotorula toruloides TaxID=5286 RepID=A0A2T0AIN1_RHOTO|nr:hypothetical protein AAT19DRAFT_8939 [Rhodotorula toruloides]
MSSPHHHRRGTGGRGSSPLEESERPYRGNTHRSPAVLRSQQAQAPRDEIDDAIEAGWDEQEEEERRLEREREEEEARQRRRRAHVRAAAGTDLAQTDGGLAAIFAADQALENRHGGVRRPAGIARQSAQQGHAQQGHASFVAPLRHFLRWVRLLTLVRVRPLSRTFSSGSQDNRRREEHVGVQTDSEGETGWNSDWDKAIDDGWESQNEANARGEEPLTHRRRPSHGARR